VPDRAGLTGRRGERERAGFEAQSGAASASPVPVAAVASSAVAAPVVPQAAGGVGGAGGGAVPPGAGGRGGGGGDGQPPGPSREAILSAPEFIAAKTGGRHEGFYRRYQDSRIPEAQKAIRSLEKRIAEHEEKIRHPERVLRPECTERERLYLIQRYWPEEIADFRAQIAVLRGIVAERQP
jgi:hypothetical protein